ncbi:MAG TPA: hypothetical protein PLW86_01065 [Rhodocyclaceae bacterium]|nr:hypothetical protein [Rhodocyclaceae bacterium]
MRYDTPWQRLPWTIPLALLALGLGIWIFVSSMNKPVNIRKPPPPVTARIIELPTPPQPEIKPEPRQDQTTARPAQPRAKPATKVSRPTKSSPSSGNPISDNEPDLSALTATPITAETSIRSAPRYSPHLGAASRLPAAGRQSPPPALSVEQEENPPENNLMTPGQGLAGWIQESEPCEFDYLRNFDYSRWMQMCGNLPQFSQPPNPWCYDAAPVLSYPGTCGEDFDKAMAALKNKDYPLALSIFKKLAERDYSPAQFNLVRTLVLHMIDDAEGLGLPRDIEQALHWYKKAAAEGNVKAIYNLALMYSDGRGVPRDEKHAAFWYRKAAYFGYANAQYNLALMYAEGRGLPQDDKQALYWYRKAAARGNPTAQYNLAVMYADGIGVAKDDKQAIDWFCKASSRGDDKARSSLTMLYPMPQTPSADELLYFCRLIANSRRQGSLPDMDMRIHEKRLSATQLENAQAAFALWKRN